MGAIPGSRAGKLYIWEANADARALYARLGYATISRQMCRVLE